MDKIKIINQLTQIGEGSISPNLLILLEIPKLFYDFNSRSVFCTIRGAMAFNRNLGPCKNKNFQSDRSTIWIIDVCAFFFENFSVQFCITILQKKIKSSKKPLSGIKKKF